MSRNTAYKIALLLLLTGAGAVGYWLWGDQLSIEALAARYGDAPRADRAPLDKAYADAMRRVALRFPDDLDAATLFSEALMDTIPWDYWTEDGDPRPQTTEFLAALE